MSNFITEEQICFFGDDRYFRIENIRRKLRNDNEFDIYKYAEWELDCALSGNKRLIKTMKQGRLLYSKGEQN